MILENLGEICLEDMHLLQYLHPHMRSTRLVHIGYLVD